ncbi:MULTISPECIES: histidine phosphatase family protein [Frankia]|uniref:Phosphoglycerate mutase 2 protein n=1 Tax=Frankia alni (strain DSM 45986 / CECT 9034 / ACN14a) TaxID=326424 RepID=Q0RU90_FRAAA|nr:MULTISPECIES: histidine phosphatase family protein [Frankia]CAJ58853.1 Putative phosphoglycerate mutase 2 protein [Frankia alni ACN14a]
MSVGGLVAELTAVRHGQSVANVAFPAARAAGRLDAGVSGRDADVELTPLGRAQAAALGRALAAEPPIIRPPEVVVCSPYLRARRTYEIAAEAAARGGLALPEPVIDDRLVDRLMGRFELMTRAAIDARFPAEAERRRASGQWDYRPPGGENFPDIARRLGALLTDLHHDHADRRVLIVAHDAVVVMLRQLVEGLSYDELGRIAAEGGIRNAGITRFTRDGDQLTLAEFNTATHLAGVSADGAA